MLKCTKILVHLKHEEFNYRQKNSSNETLTCLSMQHILYCLYRMNENYLRLLPNFKYASPVSIYHNNAILNNIKYYEIFQQK